MKSEDETPAVMLFGMLSYGPSKKQISISFLVPFAFFFFFFFWRALCSALRMIERFRLLGTSDPTSSSERGQLHN